jgi:hypothetical protein
MRHHPEALVKFLERKRALGDAKSGIVEGRVPRIWYDKTNARLRRAITMLRWWQRRHENGRREPRTLAIIPWGVLPFWAVVETFRDEHVTFELLALGFLAVLVLGSLRFAAWPHLATWCFRRHARRIRAGKFGDAVMFSVDHEWDVLNAALAAHSLSMQKAFKVSHAPPLIVGYLANTVQARASLRALRIEGKEPAFNSPSLMKLQGYAKDTASHIAARPV